MTGTAEERLKALDRLVPVWETDTIWTRFRKAEDRWSSRLFFCSESGSFTYGEIRAGAERTAAALYALGVREGSHVAVQLRNCREYVLLILALSCLGAVKVPLNAGLGPEELSYALRKSDAEYLAAAACPAEEVCREAGLRAVVLVGSGSAAAREGTPVPVLLWDRFLRGAGEALPPEAAPARDRVSDIMFTSGSTSRPKGVILTHDMLLRSAYSSCRQRRMEEGRRMLVPIPLFHAFAYVEGLLAALFVGGTVVMSEERFSTGHILELLKEFRANDLICVSLIMTNLLLREKIEPGMFPELHAAYWASSCPGWTWDEGRRRFGISDVVTSYGITECGSTAAMLCPEDPPERTSRCNGRIKDGGAAALPGADGRQLEAKILRSGTGETAAAGETGELCLRGATVTPGYYGDPEATARAFDRDGWFHTGDLCSMDEEGYLTFRGRNNDMFKINGENVSPYFLDEVIGKCPGIRAAETVGIRHPKCGEVGVAFVDCEDPGPEREAQIRSYLREHLAPFQVPGFILFLDRNLWPRTATGKITKTGLRKYAEEALSGDLRQNI